MKQVWTAFGLLIWIIVSGCSTVAPKMNNKVGGEVRIVVSNEFKENTKYRLYINNKLTKMVLKSGGVFDVSVPKGRVRITVVKQRQSAEIVLKIEQLRKYALRLQKDDSAHIELIQIRVRGE